MTNCDDAARLLVQGSSLEWLFTAQGQHIEYWQNYTGTEEEPVGLGINRTEAANAYAYSQRKLLELTAAKGAILNVLEPLEAAAKETSEERHARYEKERSERERKRELEKAEREKAKLVGAKPPLSVVH